MSDKSHSSSARPGSRLIDGQAHTHDHQRSSRRLFLRNAGLVGASTFLFNHLPLRALGVSPLAQALASAGSDDRILVIVRLKGGNDGLNTIVPIFDYGTYQAARPTLAVPQHQLIGLSNELALNQSMKAVDSLWQNGAMKVINNVGYDTQNLSHFRSSDIWASGSDADEPSTTGWLGRMLDLQYPDYLTQPPPAPLAIQIGGMSNLVFGADELNLAIGTANPQQLAQVASTGQLYDLNQVPDCYYGEQVKFMRAVTNTTFRYASDIAAAYERGTNSVEYSEDLGDQLSLVARLIRGRLGTRLYMVELDGFDTHAEQPNWHPYLLRQLGDNVAAFFRDLAQSGDDQRVVAMTISEFGRRPEENSSQGTDHGAAAPLFLFGPALNGNGLLGGLPDLHNLDEAGNMVFEVDFRRIYATLLEQWLCVSADAVDQIMGSAYERMPELGLACSTVSTYQPTAPRLDIRAYLQAGDIVIDYRLPLPGAVTVRLHDLTGRPLQTLFTGYQTAGEHSMRSAWSARQAPAGMYLCTVQYNGQSYSRKIMWTR